MPRALARAFVPLLAAACGGDAAGPPPPPTVVTVAVTPPSATLEVFDTLRLTATPRDESGAVVSGRSVTWSTSEPGNVPVTTYGRVQGVRRDTATIRATVDGVSGTATVIVRVSVVRVDVQPLYVTIPWGDTLRVQAQVFGTGGLTPDIQTVTWTSRDTVTASVSPTGLVQARGSGRTFVVAEAEGRRDSVEVSVLARVASVELSPSTDTLLADSTVQFTVALRDSTGAPATASALDWRSVDTVVATVTASGLATGRGHGATGIIVSAQGRSDTATLVVFRPTVAAVDVTPDTLALWTAERWQLGVSLHDSAGNGLTRPVTWSSSAPATATVSAAGRVTGATAGAAVIRATVDGAGDSAAVSVDTLAGRIVAMSGGEYFTCALTDAEVVYCWGANADGQVGIDRVDRPCDTIAACIGRPSRVVSSTSFSALTSGRQHTCALGVDSLAYCWGSDELGQLGGATTVTCPSGNPCSPAPQTVGGGLRFLTIAAGAFHTCGIAMDSTAYCWGNNYDDQLGGDSLVDAPHRTPVPVYGSIKFRALALGRTHSCGLASDGAPYCWGDNNPVASGTIFAKAPALLPGGAVFAQLTSGLYHACGLTAQGSAYCWGLNGFGMLGNGTTQLSVSPTPVSAGTFGSLNAGGATTCGITTGGQLLCWGLNDNGQMGIVGGNQLQPFPVPTAEAFIAVAVGWFHVCGVASGNAQCWGNNGLGQAGLGPNTPNIVGPARVIGQP